MDIERVHAEYMTTISSVLNPEEIVDILGIGSEQLVELLWDEIAVNLHKFSDYIDVTDEDED